MENLHFSPKISCSLKQTLLDIWHQKGFGVVAFVLIYLYICFKRAQFVRFMYRYSPHVHFSISFVHSDLIVNSFELLHLIFHERTNQWALAMTIRAMSPEASEKLTFFVHLHEHCVVVSERDRGGGKKEEGIERCAPSHGCVVLVVCVYGSLVFRSLWRRKALFNVKSLLPHVILTLPAPEPFLWYHTALCEASSHQCRCCCGYRGFPATHTLPHCPGSMWFPLE